MDPTDLLRTPDLLGIGRAAPPTTLRPVGGERITEDGAEVSLVPHDDHLEVAVAAPGGLAWVHLRWRHEADPDCRYLGDALERGYGDLAWRHLVPERVMPWYVLVERGGALGGFGVETGGAALAAWQIDARGVSLWLDCRAGGVPVRPGERRIVLARVRAAALDDLHPMLATARAFCRSLCPRPLLPATPVYGGNNWYYAYGDSSHDDCVADARRLAAWAEGLAVRPFSVIDDGWQIDHHPGHNAGPWHAGNADFPDPAATAATIREVGARPGIWYRPLLDAEDAPREWQLAAARPHGFSSGVVLDPTVPAVRERLHADMHRLVHDWGYELVKHDFTTYDLLGAWGNGRGGPTWIEDGWSFAADDRTTAEVVSDCYRLLREAAGDAVIIGCNTIGHLAAGLVEIQRTGDDTSGRNWERTRLMGVNTLAMRMPQHGGFFVHDADCVGLTDAIPWAFNRQWLDLLARSGTALFVSADPTAVGPEQESALRAAFARAAAGGGPAEPLDWLTTTCPERWRCDGEELHYDWTGDRGCPPPGQVGALAP